MIYVTSDLHGLEITKLKALLKKRVLTKMIGYLFWAMSSTAKMTAALQF